MKSGKGTLSCVFQASQAYRNNVPSTLKFQDAIECVSPPLFCLSIFTLFMPSSFPPFPNSSLWSFISRNLQLKIIAKCLLENCEAKQRLKEISKILRITFHVVENFNFQNYFNSFFSFLLNSNFFLEEIRQRFLFSIPSNVPLILL